MAEGRPYPEAEEDSQAAAQGSPGLEPVHEDLGQEPRYVEYFEILVKNNLVRDERSQQPILGRWL